MNLYWTSFRLYLIWFIGVHLGAFVVLLNTNLGLGIITEIVCILAIYFIAQPSVKRYQYFFNNHGHSALRMFTVIAFAHLILFLFVSSIINLLGDA